MIKLKKPLAFFDIETTGLNVATDRIVSIAITKINIDGSIEKKYRLINPTIPIPKEATDVHGISDADVSSESTFLQLSKGIHSFIGDCDLGGYNAVNYDIPLLAEEFARCGILFPKPFTKIVDAGRIFHLKNPRTLEAAYKQYCGKEMQDAHDAQADVDATLEVFMKQLEVHKDLGEDIDEIDVFCKDGDTRVDLSNKIAIVDGVPVYNFGKSKGIPVHLDSGFGKWMLDKDFTYNTKLVVKSILEQHGIKVGEIQKPSNLN